MLSHVREETERLESVILSPLATRAAESIGRQIEVTPDPVRTCFQRDRDRILHSKSFRRLMHKTQVFINPAGDHYRTRLTHTLEVAQIARTVGKALRLNEDLIEAIALGHDLGHPPFGHCGEAALDLALSQLNSNESPDRFRHDEQSLRTVDVIEGLNLTWEVRAGIGGHSKGESDLSDQDGKPTSTLEASVVRISDRIAYLNHDIDDALRFKMIDRVPEQFAYLGATHGDRIGAMVLDIIENSLEKPSINVSPEMLKTLNNLKDWLFQEVYHRYPHVYPDIGQAQELIENLFTHLVKQGAPEGYSGLQGVVDYIAGMTDRYAIRVHNSLFPEKPLLLSTSEIDLE